MSSMNRYFLCFVDANPSFSVGRERTNRISNDQDASRRHKLCKASTIRMPHMYHIFALYEVYKHTSKYINVKLH